MSQIQAFFLDVIRLSVWLAILAVIFVPLERIFALHPRTGPRKGLLADIGFYYINALLPAFLIAVPMTAFAAFLHRIQPAGLQEAVMNLPFWLRFVISLLVMEIGAYWGHRFSHENKFLWRFHSVHHAPERIDWLVNTHAHPLDVVWVRLCGLVPIYALGLAQATSDGPSMLPLLVLITGTLWSFCIHANVRWRFGIIEGVLATPAFHHWHHTNDENIDKNYATLLAFLDRVFGSYYLPKHWPPSYGLTTAQKKEQGKGD